MRDQRPLRPFHCRAMSSRPLTQIPCNLQPCLDWYTSSWGQVSSMWQIMREMRKTNAVLSKHDGMEGRLIISIIVIIAAHCNPKVSFCRKMRAAWRGKSATGNIWSLSTIMLLFSILSIIYGMCRSSGC